MSNYLFDSKSLFFFWHDSFDNPNPSKVQYIDPAWPYTDSVQGLVRQNLKNIGFQYHNGLKSILEKYCLQVNLFSEALVSTNPQYDKRLLIELQVQYMKIPSSEHVQNMFRTGCVHELFFVLTFRTIYVHNLNMFSTCFELGIFMYWISYSMNNLSLYCGLVDARISANIHLCFHRIPKKGFNNVLWEQRCIRLWKVLPKILLQNKFQPIFGNRCKRSPNHMNGNQFVLHILTLLKTKNQDLWSCSRIRDVFPAAAT